MVTTSVQRLLTVIQISVQFLAEQLDFEARCLAVIKTVEIAGGGSGPE
jgi:hypothetical protein